MYRSDDGGDTWVAVNGGLDNLDISVIAVSPHDANLVIAAQTDGALQVSTDGGASWTAGDGGAVSAVSAVVFDPGNDAAVFALDGHDVLRSADRGATWSRDALGAPLNAVAFAPGQPAVYVGADTGLFESTDGGDTWTDVAGPDVFGGWPFGDSRIIALVTDAEPFNVIGLAAEDAGTQAFRMPSATSVLRGGNAASRDTIGAAEHIAFDLTSDDPFLGRALLAGPHGIHGSVDAGARGDLATEHYGGANHWLPLNAGLHAPDANGYEVTALLFDPATARRYFAVVDGAVMRYDGKIGADLRLGGFPVNGFEDPAMIAPICCYDTEDGGKELELVFTLLNHSAETATDVEFRVTVDPPARLSASIRDQSATAIPFECSQVSTAETVCAVDEFPRGSAEGIASVVAHEPDEYRITATLTAAERDPTPSSNSATQMFAPEFPDDDAAGETEDESPANELPANEPPADEPQADDTADGDSEGDSGTETSDVPPAEDAGDADSGSETDDEPPPATGGDSGDDSGAAASDSGDAASDAGSDSSPGSARGAGSGAAAPDATPQSGGSGSWSWLSLAALSLLFGVRCRRRARARVTADA